jgi:hypothetical protein
MVTAKLFELGFLQMSPGIGDIKEVESGITDFVSAPAARGRLLGCWHAEIGRLNRIAVLRGFDTLAELTEERHRTLESGNPFGCASRISHLSVRSYANVVDLPSPGPGAEGPIYEIRSYRVRPGGLSQLRTEWSRAVPARAKLSPLLAVMYTLDGELTLTHLWAYRTFEDRARVRALAVQDGNWPPKMGPEYLDGTAMETGLYVPAKMSPLQ